MRPFWDADVFPRVDADWVWGAYDDRPRRRLVVAATNKPVVVQVYFRGLRTPKVDSKLNVRLVTVGGREQVTEVSGGVSITSKPEASTGDAWGTAALPLPAESVARPGVHLIEASVGTESMIFTLIVILGSPALPWQPNGHLNRPWLVVAELAASLVAGIEGPRAILDKLVGVVGSGFTREAAGPIRIQYLREPVGSWQLLFLMEALSDKGATEAFWGCYDCASAVVLLAAVLGVPAKLGRVVADKSLLRCTATAVGNDADEPWEIYDHYVVLYGEEVWDATFSGGNLKWTGVPKADFPARFGAGAHWDEIETAPWTLSMHPEDPVIDPGTSPGTDVDVGRLGQDLHAAGWSVRTRRGKQATWLALSDAKDRRAARLRVERRGGRAERAGDGVGRPPFDVGDWRVSLYTEGLGPEETAALTALTWSALGA